MRISWKKLFWIGTVVVRVLYFLIRVFADPDAWVWVMGILISIGFLSLTEEQQMQITKTGTAFCSLMLHFWKNAEIKVPMQTF